MHKKIRKLVPNQAVNLLKHLPTAVIANLIYGFPSRKMKFIGVTGTDGKTTTTNMIYRILKDAGFNVAMVSTINAEIGGKKIETGFHVTNPDPFMLQELITEANRNNTEIFVLEVTSHGLDQYRDWGINFEVGVITNITHEHLDYHHTFKNYFNAKARLIKSSHFAILNRDEKHFEELSALAKGKVITFGMTDDSDFNPEAVDLKLKTDAKYYRYNAFAALAASSVFGADKDKALKTLAGFAGLEGRMEEVINDLGLKIVVDFAHTPNALENVLEALQEKNDGKLITVFGSAGARDEEKRPLMGSIAAQNSDIAIITAEDPRGELEKINAAILEGAEKAGGVLGKNLFVENDRQTAIKIAISLAKKGDTVGIFGKGHEKTMALDGKNETLWSDIDAVRKVLDEKK